MTKETLKNLEIVNQLALTEEQKDATISFFAKRDEDMALIDAIDTSATERMVHVMPIMTVVREDIASQPFSREDLQKSAPETDSGYWCVPKVME
ncbi:MAG: Asp-tRNA(Asn)/Glu-tRNA(Gln) amidotransferase subunit GatC [Firmicutes bacterium]|nr:Asp-tRNA(Asn)/Glu-tRNA(Gln) amidotransferase subunit GatC [Bacillota bacterium]